MTYKDLGVKTMIVFDVVVNSAITAPPSNGGESNSSNIDNDIGGKRPRKNKSKLNYIDFLSKRYGGTSGIFGAIRMANKLITNTPLLGSNKFVSIGSKVLFTIAVS